MSRNIKGLFQIFNNSRVSDLLIIISIQLCKLNICGIVMLMEIRDKEFAKIETSESNKKTHLTYDVFLMAPNFFAYRILQEYGLPFMKYRALQQISQESMRK